METIILASNNKHKIEEYKTLLPNCKIILMEEIGFNEEIDENGKTFLENSLIKAKAVQEFAKQKNLYYSVIADDSGLCVRALNDAPGIFSARYAGEHGNNKANRQKLLKALENNQDRFAYFCTVIVKLFPNGKYIVGEGKVEGKILEKETVDNGFGYDPLFYSLELKKSFSEASIEEKNSVSHRARAVKDLLEKSNN